MPTGAASVAHAEPESVGGGEQPDTTRSDPLWALSLSTPAASAASADPLSASEAGDGPQVDPASLAKGIPARLDLTPLRPRP
jgi:hypothetical protein